MGNNNAFPQVVDFAGVKVDNVDLTEALNKIKLFLTDHKPHLIVTPNPEIIVACQQDDELKTIINQADLCTPDGISLVVVSKILRTPLKSRVAGIDLMLKLCELSTLKGYKIFLLGSAEGIAELAANKLKEQFPNLNIVGAHHGYIGDDSSLVQIIKKAQPDFLFVGLGGGKQERWLNRHLQELNVPVSMTIGGSLDVISGQKRRAPVWIQKLYIEWLYRLLSEPQRWKRQLALPKFLYLTLIDNLL